MIFFGKMTNFVAMECNDWPKSDKVIIADTLQGVGEGDLQHYLAHALCLDGAAEFSFNGNRFVMGKGDLLIVRKGRLIEDFTASDDFRVKVIYLHTAFAEAATPLTNYGMKGTLALFLNPVMRLSEFQFGMCLQDFRNVEFRHATTCFRFYEEGLRCAVQMMILDFFDFHARLYGESSISTQNAGIMTRFLGMLDNGAYRTNREVTYYASELCVTPKYLSEICKKVSGHSANFWINRYTILDISRCLRDKSLTFVQISDMFHFSSPAYFSRYVQHNLGMNPTDYRD